MLLTIGLAAICIAITVGVVGLALPRTSAPAPFTTFVQYAAMTGIFSVGSAVMYVVHRHDGARPALVVADVTMVLVPGSLAVAVAGLPARRRRVALVLLTATALAVGVCTAILDEDTSLIVKAAVLALACGFCARAAATSSVVRRGPALLIAAAMAVYAVYSAARAVVGVATGWAGPVAAVFRSLEVGAAVSIAILLVCGLAIVLAVRHSARTSTAEVPALSAIVIGDAKLLAATHGTDRLRLLVAEMRAAAHALDDHAVNVRHGVATALPCPLDTLRERMRNGFGWSAEETALLTHAAPARSRPDRP